MIVPPSLTLQMLHSLPAKVWSLPGYDALTRLWLPSIVRLRWTVIRSTLGLIKVQCWRTWNATMRHSLLLSEPVNWPPTIWEPTDSKVNCFPYWADTKRHLLPTIELLKLTHHLQGDILTRATRLTD